MGAVCGNASAAGRRTPKPQRAAAASTHHFVCIEPDRTTFFREDTLLPETLSLNLAVKIRTHDGDVVLGQAAQQLMMKIVAAGGGRVAVALLKSAAAFVDIFLETVVQILVTPAFRNFCLIIKFDFIYQQSREALRLAMHVRVCGREFGKRIGRR